MTLVVKAAGAAHFLSLAPRLVGFTPARSLVVVPMRRGRSMGVLRVDLPDASAADTVALTVIGMVCRIAGVEAMTAVVYTDAACGGRGLPHSEVAAALGARADECGIDVVDVLCVAADGWGSYLDAGCPPEGRPLAEIAAADDERLPVPVGDQSAGTDLPAVEESERAAVAAALVELDRAVPALCRSFGAGAVGGDAGGRTAGIDPSGGRTSGRHRAPAAGSDGGEQGRRTTRTVERIDPRALDAAGDLDDLPRLFEDALDAADDIDGYAAALLVWCLARPALRDIALVGWARGLDAGDTALAAQLGWERGEPYPESLARVVWGDGPRPAAERLRRALTLCRRIAALAPDPQRAGPLAVCAWLSWAMGRSTHAEPYALAALAADPGHGFAGIVLSFVQAGHLPDWAFRPSTSAPGDSFRGPLG